MNLAQLKKSLAAARKRGDWLQVARLRQLITIQTADVRDRNDLRLHLNNVARRLKDDLEENNGRKSEAILALLLIFLLNWFQTRLSEFSTEIASELVDDTLDQLTPAQLSATLNLPVSSQSDVLPSPGQVPEIPLSSNEDDGIDRKELLLILSPLLIVGGVTAAISTSQQIFESITRRAEILRRVEGARETAQWRIALRLFFSDFRSAIRQIAIGASILRTIDELFGVSDRSGGLLGSIISRLRHEKLRVIQDTRDDISDVIPVQVAVGYTLHSRFLPTTDRIHAANDGSKFYRDDRPAANRPWSQRLIPPYRENCVCFTIPIFEDPDGIEHNPEFGIRISRGQNITIRDVGTFENWFNQQRRGIKRAVVGDRLYFAAAALGNGEPRFADFFDTNGRFMQIRRLLNEGQRARDGRRTAVESIIRAKTAKHRAGWARFGGQFGNDQLAEAEYRRRLEKFLANLN